MEHYITHTIAGYMNENDLVVEYLGNGRESAKHWGIPEISKADACESI